MRILPILAAAAVAAFAVPASAAPAAAPAKAGVSSQDRYYVSQRRHHRHHRAYWRTVCKTKWRHHHRVRTCHRVRYWR